MAIGRKELCKRNLYPVSRLPLPCKFDGPPCGAGTHLVGDFRVGVVIGLFRRDGQHGCVGLLGALVVELGIVLIIPGQRRHIRHAAITKRDYKVILDASQATVQVHLMQASYQLALCSLYCRLINALSFCLICVINYLLIETLFFCKMNKDSLVLGLRAHICYVGV